MKLNTSKIVVLLTCVFVLHFLAIKPAQAAPGDLDPSFGSGGKVTSTDFGGNAIAIQSDNKIVAVGVFFRPEGAFDFGITRYNTDGSLDATFGSGGKVITYIGNLGYGFATSVAIQPDGKIIAGGSNDAYGDASYNFLLARYNTDGSLDTAFGSGGKVVTAFNHEAGLRDIAIQSDGKIVAVGNSGGNYEDPTFLLARYNANGSLDGSFGTGGIVANGFGALAYATAGVIQSDGKIVAVGTNGNAFALARYNSDGSLDVSFGTGGKVLTTFDGFTVAEDVLIQTDGKILAVGRSYTTSYYFALARYNTNGTLDASFGVGGKVATTFSSGGGYARAAAIQSDGKIVAVGTSGNDINNRFTVLRYNADGSPDVSFGSGGTVMTQISGNFDSANAVKIQSDGKIVVGGTFASLGNFGRFALVRYQGRTEASLTVTRSDDRNNAACVPGDCSLREAVNAANASGSDDAINFASGLTRITLANEIVINNAGALTLLGPGANILAIDGGPGINRIFYTNRATVTISGVTLTGGNGIGGGEIYSGIGGAVFVQGGFLTLEAVHVTGNSVNRAGGGVAFGGGDSGPVLPGTNRIINSIISGNTALQSGGISANAPLTIVNSTISGNTAALDSGGFGATGSSLTVVNSTISGNTAGDYAGGFSTWANGTTLRNVTITSNTAKRGGGIYQISEVNEDGQFQSVLDFGNTIVAGNTATTGIGPEIYNEHEITGITSVGGNLIGDSPGDSTSTGTVSIAYQPTDIRDTNPLLGPLADNGGTTPTHALLLGSPVLDRGLNTLVSPLGSVFDQRGMGFLRIHDGNGDGIAIVDIGAFEATFTFADVSGRVMTTDGLGLRNAIVSITGSNGVKQISPTSSLGYFSFSGIVTGETYTVSVISKRYRFGSRVIQVDSDLANVDFLGIE